MKWVTSCKGTTADPEPLLSILIDMVDWLNIGNSLICFLVHVLTYPPSWITGHPTFREFVYFNQVISGMFGQRSRALKEKPQLRPDAAAP